MKKKLLSTSLVVAILVGSISIVGSCKKDNSTTIGYSYTKPAVFEDGLETASLEDVGMRTASVENMMNYLNSNSTHTIHNILIIKDNMLVFEEYFRGYKLNYSSPDLNGELIDYNRTTDHPMQSISKSVTSVIFGIAVKENYITDLNKKI